MVLRCRDTGGWCNWEGRADAEEELIEMALQHAEKAHFMKRTSEVQGKARMLIRDEDEGQAQRVSGAVLLSGSC